MLVRQTPEFGMKTTVRRSHLQTVHMEVTVKDRMAEIELDEFSLGKSALQIGPQDFQFFRPAEVRPGPEVVGHNEAATPDVLAQILDFLIGELQKARLR